MLKEQTQIARELGVSMKALRRILFHSKIESDFTLIDNKRHYESENIIKAIQRSKDGVSKS